MEIGAQLSDNPLFGSSNTPIQPTIIIEMGGQHIFFTRLNLICSFSFPFAESKELLIRIGRNIGKML